MNIGNVGFSGGDQLRKVLRDLDPAEAKGVRLAILRKAAEPIRQRMEQNLVRGEAAPHIKDQIVVQPLRKIEDAEFGGSDEIPEDGAAVAIGPHKDAFYGHFIEYGTAPHGNHPGTPAKPFARPAFDDEQDRAFKILQDEVWAAIRDKAQRSTTGRGL